ncbi:acetyltransferase [Nemania sp. FL0031]|nr:acetyltransferase [Nemania sp. FL0031]
MGTPFITRLEPAKLEGYNPRLPHDQQSPHIPSAFKDAMSVREAVFVKEQGCPLESEFDIDDRRSCHWVMYASVKKIIPEERDSDGRVVQLRRSETKSTPIGTLRIVPFPHPPHPPQGARYVGGVLLPPDDIPSAASNGDNNDKNDENKSPNSNGNGNGNGNGSATTRRRHRAFSLVDEERLSAPMPFGIDRPTDFHNGTEPYVKLGRVAVLPEFRGHHVAGQLWNVAKKWLQENPTYFNPSVKELGFDVMKVGRADDIPQWNGLICVHAQEAVTQIYERWGFKVDKRMGRFHEEGIPHVGMFHRLEIKSTDPRI